jgi:ElaB/YqjD/DUF883 family membrane-anchored ribosome-binding protein
MSGSNAEAQRAKEHAQASKEHAQAAGEYGYSAMKGKGEKVLEEVKEKTVQSTEDLRARGEELRHTAEIQAKHAERSAKSAMKDARGFIRLHPYVSALLLTSFVLLGMWLASHGFSIFGRESFMRHSRGSPQFKAHQALDVVLQNYYGKGSSGLMGLGLGGGSGGEGMTKRALHQAQASWHHLTDLLSGARENVFGHSPDTSSVKSMLFGGGDESEDDSSDSGGIFSSVRKAWTDLTGASDEARVKKAEQQLRKVLQRRGGSDL